MAVGSHIPMESVGKLESERKGGKDKLMSLLEEVLNEANIERAIKAVMANKGAPGVDGMKTEQLPELFATHGNEGGNPEPDLRTHTGQAEGNTQA